MPTSVPASGAATSGSVPAAPGSPLQPATPAPRRALGWPVATERLALRPVASDDAEAFFAWRSRPDVVRYMYQPPWDRATADLKLRTWSSAPFEEVGDVLVLAVELDGDVIGETLLKWAAGPQQAEIGYAVHPDVGGLGLATEAARATLGLAFSAYGFHRVFARIDEDNVASVRVVERLGMRQEARLLENDLRDGAWSNEVVYAILDREHAELA
ncbi:GNAT family N-acetyltransferase [Promicromonospora soli]|uniref:Acetyltransferase n=1 Tax=Promicromonospora soli TaxID=2035533 RepID=A0A919G5Y5_9MICO|nr:GNAT family N-acetyltransferase [Promicromonospora soli]GHH78404.1 acetyltransferase [Promicromonospora soli]